MDNLAYVCYQIENNLHASIRIGQILRTKFVNKGSYMAFEHDTLFSQTNLISSQSNYLLFNKGSQVGVKQFSY